MNFHLQKSIAKLLETRGVGQWFFLVLVKRNENFLTFVEFVKTVNKDS